MHDMPSSPPPSTKRAAPATLRSCPVALRRHLADHGVHHAALESHIALHSRATFDIFPVCTCSAAGTTALYLSFKNVEICSQRQSHASHWLWD